MVVCHPWNLGPAAIPRTAGSPRTRRRLPGEESQGVLEPDADVPILLQHRLVHMGEADDKSRARGGA
jgi:hypothetical protein